MPRSSQRSSLPTKGRTEPLELDVSEKPPDFDIVVVVDDGETIVSVRGEIDVATAPMLWEQLADAIPKAQRRLVLDLQDTAFIDSTGLKVMVRALKRLRHQDAEFALRSPRPNALKVLSLTRLDQVIAID